jgi:hypothetical protein
MPTKISRIKLSERLSSQVTLNVTKTGNFAKELKAVGLFNQKHSSMERCSSVKGYSSHDRPDVTKTGNSALLSNTAVYFQSRMKLAIAWT